ncbi:MAG: glycosyltransferase family 4 protein, partial [Desulfopila sp.]
MVTSELRIILVFLTSLIAVVFLIPKLARIATRIGLVDQPGLRKVHDRPLPLVGGIAMVISATFSFLLFVPLVGLRGYFLGVALLLLVGFLDDFREIGHREKFLAQILATSMLFYFSDVALQSFGDLLGLGSIDVGGNVVVIWLVTVFCVVGVINAINLLDGLDGLAGGFCFLAFLTFAVHSSMAADTPAVLLNLALVGAVLGFLRYNWNTAKVFMGDAGSLCLGFSLAFMALWLTQGEGAGVQPITALLVLAVPIVDTLTVMTKRILRGQSPFRPDMYHLHHIFLRYGVSKVWAVRFILALSGLFCILSLFGEVYAWPQWLLFAVFMLYFTAYITSSFYIIRLMRVSR